MARARITAVTSERCMRTKRRTWKDALFWIAFVVVMIACAAAGVLVSWYQRR